MDVCIQPAPLAGSLDAIASKSVAHRILILASLSQTTTDINCNTTSNDIDATAACLEALGAQITRTRKGFRVVPLPSTATQRRLKQAKKNAVLDCGESGSTLRFMLPVSAALGADASFVGQGRLAKRPLSPLFEQLQAHGMSFSEQGVFPLHSQGKLQAGRFILPGNVSSQYVSGLLLAAPLMSSPVEICIEEPVESRSYIDISLAVLRDFGINVGVGTVSLNQKSYVSLIVSPADVLSAPSVLTVEGDWSNAAFWLASAALAHSISIRGLSSTSHQGDRAILAALASMGAKVGRGADEVVCSHAHLLGRTIDVSDIPDLVPPLAAVACCAQGTTQIVNAGRLRLKESDRLETVCTTLSRMGAQITIEGDGLHIEGVERLAGGEVDASNDHRIAMMAAIAGAHASGPTLIHGAECVQKSYPNFFEDFQSLGGKVTKQ